MNSTQTTTECYYLVPADVFIDVADLIQAHGIRHAIITVRRPHNAIELRLDFEDHHKKAIYMIQTVIAQYNYYLHGKLEYTINGLNTPYN